MATPNLILLGAGGHSLACIDVIEQDKNYEIAGLTGLNHEVGLSRNGYKVISTDSNLEKLAEFYEFALVSVGQIESPSTRITLYRKILQAGFKPATIISPHSYVSPKSILGEGTIVMHGAVINAGAIIGDNCIINSRSLIEHNSHIQDHCHISTGSIVNGNVNIGIGSFIGSGSVVKEGISIGKNSIVGMGSVLRHSLNDNAKYIG
jgi:sugar O-acyltransferase (sialic acid O-acetyltransferase NeuD family)